MRQEFVLKLLDQSFELSVEGVVKQNSPSHCKIMDLKTYGVKSIFMARFHLGNPQDFG
jgi:hypothetical protein